jgi:hypothetical protein
MRQVWLDGDAAHTVVLHITHGTSTVIADVVTQPDARPLFAQFLPAAGGWLVAAGPSSTVTGYRTPGSNRWLTPPKAISDWRGGPASTPRYTRTAALIPTSEPRLDLRLVVDGTQKVVTVGPS